MGSSFPLGVGIGQGQSRNHQEVSEMDRWDAGRTLAIRAAPWSLDGSEAQTLCNWDSLNDAWDVASCTRATNETKNKNETCRKIICGTFHFPIRCFCFLCNLSNTVLCGRAPLWALAKTPVPQGGEKSVGSVSGRAVDLHNRPLLPPRDVPVYSSEASG